MYRNVLITKNNTLELSYTVRVLETLADNTPSFVLDEDTILTIAADRYQPVPARYRTALCTSQRHGGRQLRLYSCSDEEATMTKEEFRQRVRKNAQARYVALREGSARLAYGASHGQRAPIQYGAHALRDHLEALTTSLGISLTGVQIVGDFSELGEIRLGVVERADGTSVAYATLEDIPAGCFYTVEGEFAGGVYRAVIPNSAGTWLARVAEISTPDGTRTRVIYRLYLHARMLRLQGDEADAAAAAVAESMARVLGVDMERVLDMKGEINREAHSTGPALPWRTDEENARLRDVVCRPPSYDGFSEMSAAAAGLLESAFCEKMQVESKEMVRFERTADGGVEVKVTDTGTVLAKYMTTSRGVQVEFPADNVGNRYYLIRKEQDARITALRVLKGL